MKKKLIQPLQCLFFLVPKLSTHDTPVLLLGEMRSIVPPVPFICRKPIESEHIQIIVVLGTFSEVFRNDTDWFSACEIATAPA